MSMPTENFKLEGLSLGAAATPTARKLLELAYDLTWTWTTGTQSLFERLDPELWILSQHNPVRMLGTLSSARLTEISNDKALSQEIDRLHEARRTSENAGAWFGSASKTLESGWRPFLAAYFCAEFGLTECFQIYSGGLGLLAGDHVRSAAQLGLPLIGVGLLYRNGYFHQTLDGSGMQQEVFPPLDAPNQPVRRVIDALTGQQLRVKVELPGRSASVAVWRSDIGGVRLYLLDTNIEENPAHDREITANLYLGDQTRRIEQEIVLGIGGIRALAAIGEEPTVFHMNEGHAAFMGLERIRMFREQFPHLNFDQAREAAAPSHIFTTHTPVPAGIDRFNAALVGHYFNEYCAKLGLDLEGFLALGREDVSNKSEAFSMAVLALRISKFCNGVSRLHGEVSRGMWKNIWPGIPESDVPIGHVTNGAHTDMWVGERMAKVFDQHLPKNWREKPQDNATWSGIERVPHAEIWNARNAARKDLLRFCAERMAGGKCGGISAQLRDDVLTIGFARRFAGYKRATLLFRDPARLSRLLEGREGRPIQLIISGKSHPGDGWGKHLIREIVEFARSKQSHGRILFLEDYSIEIAKEMVRGCDVWLNNPIRGLEASGTSGMKAAMNGVLNASILDGWWDEAYEDGVGYEIRAKGTYPSDAPNEEREDFEADALYSLIEQQLLPEFYTRDASGIPTRWITKVSKCIARLSPTFSTHRMVAEYAERYYFEAHNAATRLLRESSSPQSPQGGKTSLQVRSAAELADHIARYRAHWPQVGLRDLRVSPVDASGMCTVDVATRIDGLRPPEVSIQAISGPISASGIIEHARTIPLSAAANGQTSDGWVRYTGTLKVDLPATGTLAVAARIVPRDERLVSPFIPGLVSSSETREIQAQDAPSPATVRR